MINLGDKVTWAEGTSSIRFYEGTVIAMDNGWATIERGKRLKQKMVPVRFLTPASEPSDADVIMQAIHDNLKEDLCSSQEAESASSSPSS